MNDNEINDLSELPEELVSEESEAPSEEAVAEKASETKEIVGIRFKKSGKTYYFEPNGFTLAQDDKVIVETSRGAEYGFTAVPNRMLSVSEISEPLRPVIRLATEEDGRIHEENVKREIDAFNACIALIDKHRLEMKLIDAELSFDRSKLLFYFSAEGRVDFRELVKDLASAFHTRIEMRQIGIRDEAKILGGLGICGRPYCCNTFLTDFGQVSVKMAKEQNLSLNAAKISGSCGRLMCCLRYEYDTYLKEKALTPKVDSRVMTPSGLGTVVEANPLAGIVKVKLDDKGEDGEAVLFVREDVVDEGAYDGRVLTKTPIPDRKSKNDDIPSFAQFASSSAPSYASAEPDKDEKGIQSTQASKPAQPKQPARSEETEGGKDEERFQRRDRHKHHHKGDRPKDRPIQSENGDGQSKNPQNQQRNHDKHREKNREQRSEQRTEQNAQAAQNAQGGQNGHKKHKNRRPYYKHGNKNKGGSGEGGQQA